MAGHQETGLHHLPFRVRSPSNRHLETSFNKPSNFQSRNNANPKRVPESLHFSPGAFRLRSPTESSMSSISSANVPDSATTHSISTLASPISTSYASDVQDLFSQHGFEGSRPTSRVCHRHQPSNGTCSTFVNDEDDVAAVNGYSDLYLKIRQIQDDRRTADAHDNQAIDELPPISPVTESPGKEEEISTPIDSSEPAETESGCDATTTRWENGSTTSEDISEDDSDLVMSYVLQLVYGVDLKEASIPQPVAHRLVLNFVQDIGQHMWQAPSDTQLSHTLSNSSSSSTPSQGSGDRGNGRGGKRKKQGRREDEGDEFSDGEGSGIMPTKRARPNPKDDENLRLSCPFRKRNPHRFNVRDHHSCAMTYFPKFAELRQHIVKQHKRDDPSAFVCDRCNRDFLTRKELRDHQRQPKELMCDLADHDAENGIDGPTATKLLSRKRASGTSPEIQWREIWNILFPDDDDHEVKPFDFTPVIEHFELETDYLVSFQELQADLRDKMRNPQTLETLATKFQQCFVETLQRLISEAQSKPYTNRSNKKSEIARSQIPQNPILRKSRDILPRPDSGVIMDDGSEESGSIMGSGLGHRESIRTVKGAARRGSSQVPEILREVLPARTTPPVFDNGLMRQPSVPPLGMNGGPMDPAAVQAWNNGVLYSQVGDLGLQNPLLHTGNLTPQPEYMNWGDPLYQAGFADLGNGFNGFNGQ